MSSYTGVHKIKQPVLAASCKRNNIYERYVEQDQSETAYLRQGESGPITFFISHPPSDSDPDSGFLKDASTLRDTAFFSTIWLTSLGRVIRFS